MEKTLFMPSYFMDPLQNALIGCNIENARIEIIGEAIKLTANMTDAEIYLLGVAVGQRLML